MTDRLSWFDQTLKDFYALPGTVLKQYVVDMQREAKWERETCPEFNVDPHERPGCAAHDDDDCPTCKVSVHECPCSGSSSLNELRESGCDICETLYRQALETPAAKAWLAEKAKRPPIESDRTKLSNEVAPDWSAMGQHPFFAMLPKERK